MIQAIDGIVVGVVMLMVMKTEKVLLSSFHFLLLSRHYHSIIVSDHQHRGSAHIPTWYCVCVRVYEWCIQRCNSFDHICCRWCDDDICLLSIPFLHYVIPSQLNAYEGKHTYRPLQSHMILCPMIPSLIRCCWYVRVVARNCTSLSDTMFHLLEMEAEAK